MNTQTKTKHTPGRWYFRPEEPSIEAEHSDNPGFFVTVADCGKSRTLSDDQMKANARLIAAAPELFNALGRMLVGVTNQSTEDCEWYEGILDDAIDEARAAIAKARGEA